MDSTSGQWRRRLLILRGVLVVTVAVLAAAASLRQTPLPVQLLPMVAVLWLPALSYWPTRGRDDRTQQNWLAAELLYDTLAFMLLMYLLGGAANPLTFYLLVPLLVTALTQDTTRTVLLCLLQIAGYGVLLYWHQTPSAHSELHAMTHDMPALHGHGMWLAFSLVGIALAGLGQSTQRAQTLRASQHATELTLAMQRERMYQLASTLADRAHELNTPISTLMLQLDGLTESLPADDPRQPELAQMQSLVERMAAVLKQPKPDETPHTDVAPSQLTQQLHDALRLLAPDLRVEWQGDDDRPLSPAYAWQRIFLNLGYNACDAGATCLIIKTARDGTMRILQVSDNGPRQAERSRNGLGVGLALIDTTLAALGGTLRLRQSADWTQAIVQIPDRTPE